MGYDADLAEYDRDGIRAPGKLIADAHTSRWVEKEHIRLAQKARQSQKAARRDREAVDR